MGSGDWTVSESGRGELESAVAESAVSAVGPAVSSGVPWKESSEPLL
jgi:hypothetical protein